MKKIITKTDLYKTSQNLFLESLVLNSKLRSAVLNGASKEYLEALDKEEKQARKAYKKTLCRLGRGKRSHEQVVADTSLNGLKRQKNRSNAFYNYEY